MSNLSESAKHVSWLVDNFVAGQPSAHEAIVVSVDGLPVAVSHGIDRDAADRFAAVSSGLIGLAHGASERFQGGHVHEVIVEMERAFVLVTGIPDGSSLAVVAAGDADIGTLGYEMAMLAEQIGTYLTPELRTELQYALPR
ncbi:MAG: roadblock/LC7 domain-containing protein [Acidimicrobiia bacterium]|nr:roadblock/LC7 domain-containing protein [Acidimicrobiia bacterium]MDH5238459.1 roadblock/LC7 domain-containing protein [Acidimicrobiia bacterium]